MHMCIFCFSFIGLTANEKERALLSHTTRDHFPAMQSNNAKENQRLGKMRGRRNRNEIGEGAVDNRNAA